MIVFFVKSDVADLFIGDIFCIIAGGTTIYLSPIIYSTQPITHIYNLEMTIK